jgi:CheY-like chemotaxis protein
MLDDKVNILLVDDQPAKLLTYQAILGDVGENLLTANNATEALELLLKNDVAVVLIDVYMPDIDGFQLAAMIRNHPRFEKTALIFISAILLTDVDRLRGYEMGAVDYVPVPVIPEVLRAKVRSSSSCIARPDSSSSSTANSRRGSQNVQPRSAPQHVSFGRPSDSAAWRLPPARWAVGNGTSRAEARRGTRANVRSSASTPAHSCRPSTVCGH